MIYLDNSATTKPYDEVVDTFQKVATTYFANPSSIHALGGEVEALLTKSKEQIASLLEIKPHEVIYTSGGTESNNLAIKGTAHGYQNRGNHLITSKVEHPSVLETFRYLETQGYSVTYLSVDESGHISLEELKESITDQTILVSLMHVNNEIGTIQPIEQVADLLADYPKTVFHVDHVQGFGKLSLPYHHPHLDLVTISGHKIHGLKGSGCLIKKDHIHLTPLQHGGGQEHGVRPGTENIASAVSFAKAMRIAKENEKSYQKLEPLRETLVDDLSKYDNVKINSPRNGASHILNFSVQNFKPEVLIHALKEEGVIVSTKSACSSKDNEVSHVLEACGLSDVSASSAIRVSLTTEQTIEEVQSFLQAFQNVMNKYEKIMGS
ncbi:cysteine desulfurase family protein [Alkalibacillus almallahensis]|uniref:cysteine desulfurase family protein n=1 Tax=Alkalibacillus almallahensis TaxID=1379154 RepID=UPI00141F4259|nr:cysteine desulfurase family protein [Alkalibacillus almallahensis]NIK11057.1 cysteine desulfurase [Alkalibacillus almallahensis]